MCIVAEVVHRSSFSFPAFCVRWLKTASLFRKIWPLKKRPLHAAECYIEYTKFISKKGKCNFVQIILLLRFDTHEIRIVSHQFETIGKHKVI